jgi:hypothetical protein
MHKNLTPAQKELFRRWVAEGAVYEPHWAYTPLVKPEVPRVKTVTNPIDAFIQARLGEKKIQPSPEAEKTRLLRRVSLDLTGLPPTPAETAAFLAAVSVFAACSAGQQLFMKYCWKKFVVTQSPPDDGRTDPPAA